MMPTPNFLKLSDNCRGFTQYFEKNGMLKHSPLKVNRRFGGIYRLHIQCRRISRARNELTDCFHAGFLLGLLFDREDGCDIFLRNVGWLSTDYTTSYPRRQYSSGNILLPYYYRSPVKKTENTTRGIRCADHATPSIHKSWYYFAKKWRSLGGHSSLADQSHGVFFNYYHRALWNFNGKLAVINILGNTVLISLRSSLAHYRLWGTHCNHASDL
jgi:hypothetical protein